MIKLAIVFCLIVVAFGASKYPINHVVLLMMENRSYDHMLGWMKAGGEFGNPEVDGLNGDECNFVNPEKPLLGKVCISHSAPDHSTYDPNHSYVATTERIFSCNYNLNITQPNNSTNPCVNHASVNGIPDMGGFVLSARQNNHTGRTEMSAQNSSDVPIITTLANEFTQFDRFFASYPGCTNPNRLFLHTGTCDGCYGNEQPVGYITNITLQEVFSQHNKTWRYYQEGNPPDWFSYISYFNDNYNNTALFPPMQRFYHDAAIGDLPHYSFINPADAFNPKNIFTKSYGLMNDQHPDHSVREGERLMKNVYEALRSSPLWNETLFIITYDEHGGFYDHVPPPQFDIPNPDGKNNTYGFDFKRLGLRVPMILISPWIEKGQLVSEPAPNQKPFPSSQFDHTSTLKSIAKIFGIDHKFSDRSEWAATFDDLLLQRTEPRTDCPEQLPYIPPPTAEDIEYLSTRPLKDRLVNRVKVICAKIRPNDPSCGADVKTYKDLYRFINEEVSNLAQTY